ncbi:MAG: type II toxin-antitoxin system PemK/MazF family toxin [Thiomonas sp.]|jgi:mRNA interferase MazF|uniref:Transcriptional modulator of MazE/toxin, MazF n=1 Tax=Thiomonas intermedia (strain K12) TaxID=75379 RepID=D5X515_THIK1|nr:type II toxin-antitoxin system PemK/MazF family toxin [Thiomonas arsenitoxydans]MDE1979160.1 type II toxin-antitoxin system PemK/MazF family toxin [Betaproteobacteria bacterium]MDE2269984.1 type II toxin-antitoxin system PemK/MazF family toxin [Betaproteobacteria bacterium]OZB68856.1 MAG: growth inhibitor PemK [Thiomonas sp. 14-64-326]HML83184.1 type II toxin-antitoxin system PemK/MazF family toxin [Thiomonas arsenitoxydans]
MEVKRGDLITIALQGDYGKPRPALVMQDDAFGALPSVSVLRLTSELRDWPLFRITVEPHASNGLQKTSQVMIDKPIAVPKTKIGQRIGRLDEASMQTVSAAFGRFHGLKAGK